MNILVTGGAGFIGSALCRHLLAETAHSVVDLDKLTYAGNAASVADLAHHPRYRLIEGDICDAGLLAKVFRDESIDLVMHLAAETHADRSIEGPGAFIQANIVGTFQLLEAARSHWRTLPSARLEQFRFHHVSTDEVYGDLPLDDSLFTEAAAFAPSSPYSASKAASHHLVLAWHRTYGLPVTVSNGSNTYGPRHFPEKLIPLTILNALERRPIDVYGTGQNIRDWIHVDDHVRALELVATRGTIGRTYNVGGGSQRTNLSVVHLICDLVDRFAGEAGRPRRKLVRFVEDRPGHDLRYALDTSRIESELGWKPTVVFEDGLESTVRWFLDNPDWWRPIREGVDAGRRLGLPASEARD